MVLHHSTYIHSIKDAGSLLVPKTEDYMVGV